MDGSLQVASQTRLSGMARYYDGRPVPRVNFSVSGGESRFVTSQTDGTYGFDLSPGANYVVRPSKEMSDSEPHTVTTLDITLLRRDILGIAHFDSIYKLLAADVNGSAKATTLDITLMRRVILGIETNFPAGFWKSLRSDQTFSLPRNPWLYDSARTVSGLAADLSNQDFVLIRHGDVNGSWTASPTTSPGGLSSGGRSVGLHNVARDNAGTVAFRFGSLSVHGSTLMALPVTVSGFDRVTSVQFTLSWDPALFLFGGVGNLGLPGLSSGNFGTMRTHEGKLSFSWDDPTGVGLSVKDGTGMLALSLFARGLDAEGAAVSFGDDPTPREVTIQARLGQRVSETAWVNTQVIKQAPGLAVMHVLPNKLVRLAVRTSLGTTHVIEYTSDLTDKPWAVFQEIKGDGSVQIVDDLAPFEPFRFYRSRIAP